MKENMMTKNIFLSAKNVVDCLKIEAAKNIHHKVKITPELAEFILELCSNIANREIKPVSLRKYISDMKNGLWADTDPICIGSDNFIQNGHHRLRSVAMSGVSVDFRFSFDHPPSSFAFFGRGVGIRTQTDVQTIHQFQQHGTINPNLKTHTPTIVTLRRLCGYSSLSTTEERNEINRLLGGLGPFMDDLILRTGKQKLMAHAVRGALVCRLHQVKDDKQRYDLLLDQAEAFVANFGADKSTGLLKTYLENMTEKQGRSGEQVRATVGWICWNAKDRNRQTRPKITDGIMQKAISEIRLVMDQI